MTEIRQRMNRRMAAVLIAFSLLLGSTGLASLASLTDTLNIQTDMSLVTIDLQANASQSVTTTLAPWSDLPQFRFVPLSMSNAGTGSLTYSISSSSATPTGDLASAVVLGLDKGLTPAECSGRDPVSGNPVSGTPINIVGNQSLSNFTMTAQSIPAGGAQELCLSYYLPAGSYSQTATQHNFVFSATHP